MMLFPILLESRNNIEIVSTYTSKPKSPVGFFFWALADSIVLFNTSLEKSIAVTAFWEELW